MRTLSTFIVLTGLSLLFAVPASADYRDDWSGDYYGYIEDRLDEWVNFAEDLGFEIITAETGEIRSTENIWFDLGPGTYHAYAEGGRNIDDLDMVVYDSWGGELASDYMADNFPIADFTIYDWQDVEFELSVFTYSDYDDRGDFCFVLAREDDYYDNDRGRDRDYNGRDRYDRDEWDNRDNRDGHDGRDNRDDRNWRDRDDNDRDRGNRGHYRDDRDGWSADWEDWWSGYDYGRGRDRYDGRSYGGNREIVEDELDYLYEFAWSRDMNPVMDDIDQINDVRTYSLTLQEGYYVAFAAGGPDIEDLDLHVSWREGWEVAEDIGIDAAPAVWFYVPNRTTIDIEVEVFSFSGNNFEDYFCLLVCED